MIHVIIPIISILNINLALKFIVLSQIDILNSLDVIQNIHFLFENIAFPKFFPNLLRFIIYNFLLYYHHSLSLDLSESMETLLIKVIIV